MCIRPGVDPQQHARLIADQDVGCLVRTIAIRAKVAFNGGQRAPAAFPLAPGPEREADTLAYWASATKGMAATAMLVAHARGLLDYDEPVASYWPEFARNGKAGITLRHLLSHQAGLAALDRRLDLEIAADPDALASILADQRPLWTPGARQGYHAWTFGWCESEALRRVDADGGAAASGRSAGSGLDERSGSN